MDKLALVELGSYIVIILGIIMVWAQYTTFGLLLLIGGTVGLAGLTYYLNFYFSNKSDEESIYEEIN